MRLRLLAPVPQNSSQSDSCANKQAGRSLRCMVNWSRSDSWTLREFQPSLMRETAAFVAVLVWCVFFGGLSPLSIF